MKTSDLTGAELDKVIAKIEGIEVQYLTGVLQAMHHAYGLGEYSPSTNWSQGGPLIEKEGIKIKVHVVENGKITSWSAGWEWPMIKTDIECCGPTPLIAAMRAIVASVYGDTVPTDGR